MAVTSNGKLVLVTGGSGFVGSHTVNNCLRHGYRVRVAGRSQRSCDGMLTIHAQYKDSLETVVVPDITAEAAFDQAVQGVDGIIHMASPFKYCIDDNEKDLVLPALQGTKGILQSALGHGDGVKRVVITASFAAVADFSKGLWPGHTYDESQWNPMSYKDTVEDKRGLAYAGSKKLAEEAAWEFMKQNPEARFSLATINPVMIYGPPFPGSVSQGHLGQSLSEVNALVNGDLEETPPTPMPVAVDVREVAEAHRLAFESDQAQPGRFLLCSGHFDWQGISDVVAQQIPELKSRLPKQKRETSTEAQHYGIDTGKARIVLGLHFRAVEDTFLDTVREMTKSDR